MKRVFFKTKSVTGRQKNKYERIYKLQSHAETTYKIFKATLDSVVVPPNLEPELWRTWKTIELILSTVSADYTYTYKRRLGLIVYTYLLGSK